MNIYDYADAMNLHIEWHRPFCQNGRIYCHFERVEIKQGPGLLGVSGNGRSHDEAIRDYISQIGGKVAVADARNEHRREFMVPPNLTA